MAGAVFSSILGRNPHEARPVLDLFRGSAEQSTQCADALNLVLIRSGRFDFDSCQAFARNTNEYVREACAGHSYVRSIPSGNLDPPVLGSKGIFKGINDSFKTNGTGTPKTAFPDNDDSPSKADERFLIT
jgi:hypothetical protein